MRKRAAALAALGILVAVSSCRRTLPASAQDAGSDGGAPVDRRRPAFDVPVVDAPVIDAATEVTGDAGVEAPGDATMEAPGDAATAACPAGVAPLDVWLRLLWRGDGARLLLPVARRDARGDSQSAGPELLDGRLFVRRAPHLLRRSSGQEHLARLRSARSAHSNRGACRGSRYSRRDGDVCTTLELGGAASNPLPITGPPGRANANAWRAPCDGSEVPTFAIGGLGTVTPGTSGTLLPFPRYDVHVVLFF